MRTGRRESRSEPQISRVRCQEAGWQASLHLGTRGLVPSLRSPGLCGGGGGGKERYECHRYSMTHGALLHRLGKGVRGWGLGTSRVRFC